MELLADAGKANAGDLDLSKWQATWSYF